ncbi:hypothetical protein JTB14_001630 [Gonioctena quinquepunctata]|nr:hypothetical protein JTB14_001630 [Gonioctena quinquepunctata]
MVQIQLVSEQQDTFSEKNMEKETNQLVSDLDCNDSSGPHCPLEVHPEIEETHIDNPKKSEEFHNIPSSDRGNFGDSLTEYERKIVFKLGPSKPQGPFHI